MGILPPPKPADWTPIDLDDHVDLLAGPSLPPLSTIQPRAERPATWSSRRIVSAERVRPAAKSWPDRPFRRSGHPLDWIEAIRNTPEEGEEEKV